MSTAVERTGAPLAHHVSGILDINAKHQGLKTLGVTDSFGGA